MERISSSGRSKTTKTGWDRSTFDEGIDTRARTEAGLGRRQSIDSWMPFPDEVIREPAGKHRSLCAVLIHDLGARVSMSEPKEVGKEESSR